MRPFYLLILLLAGNANSLLADTFRGYLITKNNIRLTGFISTISHDDNGSQVAFINDFGDVYRIHPAWVSGFAFEKDHKTYLYLSRTDKRKWVFLRLLYQGEYISLLQSPEMQISQVLTVNGFEQRTIRRQEFWLETPGRSTFPVRRSNFRKTMRRFCERGAPRLKANIGKSGYRYRNLEEIVQAFEAEKKKKKRKI